MLEVITVYLFHFMYKGVEPGSDTERPTLKSLTFTAVPPRCLSLQVLPAQVVEEEQVQQSLIPSLV